MLPADAKAVRALLNLTFIKASSEHCQTQSIVYK